MTVSPTHLDAIKPSLSAVICLLKYQHDHPRSIALLGLANAHLQQVDVLLQWVDNEQAVTLVQAVQASVMTWAERAVSAQWSAQACDHLCGGIQQLSDALVASDPSLLSALLDDKQWLASTTPSVESDLAVTNAVQDGGRKESEPRHLRVLLVALGSARYAIPLKHIDAVIRLHVAQLAVYRQGNGPLLSYQDRTYRVRHLKDVLHLSCRSQHDTTAIKQPVVLLSADQSHLAVQVDRLLHVTTMDCLDISSPPIYPSGHL